MDEFRLGFTRPGTLVAGYTDAGVRRWLANMEAIEIHPSHDRLALLPAEVRQDIQLRAIHALPRSAILTLDNATLALYHSEIANELAALWCDLKDHHG